jgi:hypothetical protein
MVSSSDSTTANNMCEWITITAPNTIHDSNANVGQAWLAALQALVTRKKCDGFQNCHWGRVTEDDTQLFIWTSWANKTAYDLYAGGDAHRLVYEQLDQVSSTPIVTRLIMYDSTVSYARFSLSKYWPSITIMYFDRPLTESRRRELRKIGVMNSSFSMHNHGNKLSSRGVLLRDGHLPDEDTPAKAYVLLDYWNSPAREAMVKSQYAEAYRVPPDGTQCLPRYFADKVLAEGCIRVEIWHMRFERLLARCVDRFPSEVVCAPSLEH